MLKKKKSLSLEDCAALARISALPEWEVLQKVMDNRVVSDKNSILTYPEDEPLKLAVKKAFYRGRISAINLIKKEINGAAALLEEREEKKPKKKIKK